MVKWESNGDIVISGVSGRFPDCDNVEEFKNSLFSGVNLCTTEDRRWPKKLYGLPLRSGLLKDITKFDGTFFGIHGKQANNMDPQLRILLEVVYEAIFDSGYSAHSLRRSNIGVFIGQDHSEPVEVFNDDKDSVYGMSGYMRSMNANRISYCFDFKGPSHTVDTACSSSLYAFHQATVAIQNNQCKAAIVAGINLTLNPTLVKQFVEMNVLSPDGQCKAFDALADGYAKSEAVSAVFLQRSSDARRIYSTILHTKTNTDGAKLQGITYPSAIMQRHLFEEVYREIQLDPKNVFYVEAHATGTNIGDPQEAQAITEVFCKDRSEPLLIGSVKSNMGHSEAASGYNEIEQINENLTIGELGLDSLMAVEVKQYLERECTMDFSIQEIRQLTLKKLREIGGDPIFTSTNQLTNKNTIRRTKLPENIIIQLNDLKSPKTIFMVPAFEQSPLTLKTLSCHLNRSSYGVQRPSKETNYSIEELAEFYLKQIKSHQPEGPYQICGYSFGGLVAFEMALALQKELGTEKGVNTLFLLDSSPDFLNFYAFTVAENPQNLPFEISSTELRKILQRFTESTSQDEYWIYLENIIGRQLDREIFGSFFETSLRNLLTVDRYRVNGKFKGNVSLIKSESSAKMASHMPDDFGLSKVVDGKIDVHVVSGDHHSFLEGTNAINVSKVINSQLELSN